MVTTIGVAFPGDGRSPSVRSGVPYSIARGLSATGVCVRHVRAEPPPPLDRLFLHVLTAMHVPSALGRGSPRLGRSLAYNGATLGAVQTFAARVRLGYQRDLDGVVQVGSSYALPASTRAVTHDDMTVVQAVEAGYALTSLPRGHLERRIERQRLAYERAVACCAVTRWAAESIVEDYGIPAAKVHVVGGGRNHEPRPLERDWAVPRYLFVGKDWERKNGAAVLRAFVRLRRDVPEAALDVVGNHPSIDVAGVSAHGGLDPRCGSDRARMHALFERATCFVLPSWHEPSGIVFSEANAAGVPSIGSTEGGSSELIGDAGRVVHPGDDDALLAAMRDLADPATAARLGEVARRRSRLFTWEAVGERLLRALDLPGVRTHGLAPFL